MANEILCSISTRGRYHTTLPLALMSIINQTKLPDKVIIFDDNDDPIDVRELPHYQHMFNIMDMKGIQWEWAFAEKKGQHHNHQKANSMGYKWVWRMDDDTVAEPDTLKNLYGYANVDVGAIGGSVITPPHYVFAEPTGKIENIDSEPNIQWGPISKLTEVDHLHCTFLYRAGIVDYCLALSKVAHREETLFTYELKQKGYRVLAIPDTVTWHLKNPSGGIRDGVAELFVKDEEIFRKRLTISDQTIVVLDCGMGDHIMFKKILPEIKNPLIFSCYPDIVPGKSIAEAHAMLGDIGGYNIYAKMDQWNWKGSVVDAFRKMYVK